MSATYGMASSLMALVLSVREALARARERFVYELRCSRRGVCSVQHHNLTTLQRALLAQSFMPYEQERAKARMSDGGKGGINKGTVELQRFEQDSRDRASLASKLAGERAGVSARMMSHAQKVVEHSVPALMARRF
jgi:hypothetical protein